MINLTQTHKDRLNSLFENLLEAPILGYPGVHNPILHCNMSQKELVALLYRRQKGSMVVIGYVSRTLIPHKKVLPSININILYRSLKSCSKEPINSSKQF